MIEQLGQAGASARLYLKPAGFLESPQFYDAANSRLNNSLLWYSQVEFWLFEDDKPAIRALVPVAQLDEAICLLPAPLQPRAAQLIENLGRVHAPLTLGERILRFDQPQVMGILNATPDSFSDGSGYDNNPEAAADAAFLMFRQGAAIIDIGGESTRPGATKIWEGDEIARVVPVIEKLSGSGMILSVDTRKAAVMEAALAAGAAIINDISALRHDPRSLEVALKSDAPVVIMHAPAAGDDPHDGASYGNVVTDVFDFFETRIAELIGHGIAREKIIVDPGLGFGKSLGNNLAILNALPLFHALGQPLLVGASRKRMIGALSNEAPVEERLGGSLMLATRAIESGAQILRVHDVPETLQAAQVWRGLRDAGVTARV
ncbi:MAG: dihydropteroate synthase [Parasphingorhabdus sp.]|nr:dihydropteroate synthase [Parasphingorhabdus sp.]